MCTEYKIVYHVFTDNRDEYFPEKSLEQAETLYQHWLEEYGNVRLYETLYETGEDYENETNVRENCIMSSGNYPQ